jgi:NAD-dependent DNA ligase
METLKSDDLRLTAQQNKELAQAILQKTLPDAEKAILDAIALKAPDETLLDLQRQRDEVSESFNKFINQAHQRDIESLSNAFVSTDLANYARVISCSTGKAKLAIEKLDNIRNNLKILAQFLELGTVIAGAITSGNVANLTSIIEKVDAMVTQEFARSLTADELSTRKDELASCLPAASQ